MRPHMYPQPEEPDQYLYQPPAPDIDSPPTPSDSTDVRARLVRRFEAWLDEVLVDEEAPAGLAKDILERLQADDVAAAETSDLYHLRAALTALTEETRVQGNSFQQLQNGMDQLQSNINQLQSGSNKIQEGLSPVQSLVESVQALSQRDTQTQEEQLAQARQAAQQESIKTTLDVLIDVRDRLVHAKNLAQAKTDRTTGAGERSGLLARILPAGKGPVSQTDPGLIQALVKGLNRIDEVLQQWNVRAMACVGQAFDTQTMQAIERVEVPDKPDNTVLEICREGYWWDDKVYRVAQVKVTTNPTNTSEA